MMSNPTLKRAVRRGVAAIGQPLGRTVNLRRRRLVPGDWGLDVAPSGRIELHGMALPELTETYGSPLRVIDLVRRRDAVAAACCVSGIAQGADLGASWRLLSEAAGAGEWGRVARSPHELATSAGEGCPAQRTIVLGSTFDRSFIAHTASLGVRAHCVDATASKWNDLTEFAGVTGVWHRGGAKAVGSTVRAFESLRAGTPDRAADLVIETDLTVTGPAAVEAVGRIVDEVFGSVAGRFGTVVVRFQTVAATSAAIPRWSRQLNQTFAVDLLAPDRTSWSPLVAVRQVRSRIDAVTDRAATILLDPGSGLTADSEFLLATVIDVDRSGDVNYVVLDAGINLADDTLIRYQHLLNTTRTQPAKPSTSAAAYRVVGPICTPADVLYANWRFDNVEVGDVLAVMDTGTGQSVASTAFSFPRPAVVEVGDGAKVVRRRETFDDLLALDARPGTSVLDPQN